HIPVHKDAKTLMEAIEKRFGGNKDTKKVHKTLLKQQYENFTGSSSESLDQIHDRLQKLISQLEILGESLSQEDINLNLKIYEEDVKSSSSTSSTTQNITFVSSQNTDSTNESVSVVVASAKVYVFAIPNVDTLSNDMAMLTVRARRFLQRTRRNLGANGTTSLRFDVSKVECYNCHRKGHFARKCSSPKDTRRNVAVNTQRRNVPVETSTSNALVSQCDGVRSYDWSFQAEEEPTNYALMAFTSLSSLSSDNELRDNALVELRRKFERAEQERGELKLRLEKFQTSSKNLSQLLASQTNDKTRLGYNNQVFNSFVFDCDEMFSSESDVSMHASPIYARYQSGEGYNVVLPPYTGTFMPPNPDLVFHDAPTVNETVPTAFNVELSPTKPNKDVSQSNRPTAPIIEDCVSDSEDDYEGEPMTAQKAPSFVQTTKHVKTPRPSDKTVEHPIPANHLRKDFPKSKGHRNSRNQKACFVCKSLTHLIKDSKTVGTKPHSPPRKTINHRPSPPTSNFPPKVTTVKAPKVNVVKGVKENWDKRVIDSGCSRHMTGNMSYLTDFEEINGGYVAFGRNPKCGKITSKGKIRTCKFDFDGVYFVKELKFNLFSVSQMCDKKNSVLFTDTECIVLSPEFKLLDENQVLLRVPERTICKFDRKADEGFLVGYSVSSKAIRVFNSRTRIVQETLHINFLENQPNVVGSGPTWLFDIDTLTKSMNYQPVTIGYQSNPIADPQNTDGDATFKVKEPEFEVEKPESKVYVSPSSSAKTKKHDDKTKREDKGKILVVGQISTNNTNTFSTAGPSNTAVSLTHRKYSYVDPSQYPDDPNMPALEDITYSDDEDDVGAEADFTNLETTITVSPIPTTRVHKDHFVTQIIGDLSLATQTKSMTRMVKDQGGLTQINNEDFHTYMFACFLSQKEPKRQEGIDYEEVFALVTRIEAIRLFLAYASFMGFMMYQMDVKSAFLYGSIEEEVYVCKPLGFEDPDYPDKVYIDDIIFGSTNKDLCKAFEKLMKDKFQMSSIGELTFFLGLQVKQKQDGIFISQDKYVAKILRKFGLNDGKSTSTPIDTEKPLLKDLDGEDVDVHTYRSVIGSLMYLTLLRPDIMFAVCTIVATSSTKAKYVAAASCCAQTNDVVRLQALIDRKKVIITEDTIRQALRLDDAESIDCLPNEEIFTELARMGLVRNVDSSSKFYMYPRFLQLIIRKGFSRVNTPLFEGMLVPLQAADDVDDVVAASVPAADVDPTPPSHTPTTTPPPPQQEILLWMIRRMHLNRRIIELIDADDDVIMEEVDAEKDAKVAEENADVQRRQEEDDVIEQVKEKEKQDNAVLRYQALKRKPQTEAQARKNLMVYLKNVDGFKMDYFKGNQSNPSAGVQDNFDAEKVGEEIVQQYVLFPVWSFGSTNPHNTAGDDAFDEKEPEFEGRKPESEVNVSPSSSAQSKKHDDKTKREAKGKSPIESLTGYRNLSAEFEDFSNNNINEDNVAGTLVLAIGQLSPNSTNTFSVASPSNAAASPTHGKSLYVD
nr:copia protein [Tanacetum cinerariifolium]